MSDDNWTIELERSEYHGLIFALMSNGISPATIAKELGGLRTREVVAIDDQLTHRIDAAWNRWLALKGLNPAMRAPIACVCLGRGRIWYGSTATWRGGMGGASMTEDVCDRCWGSGNRASPGKDLRRELAESRSVFLHRMATDPAFRWKHIAKRFARRAFNWRENYRSAFKYDVAQLRAENERLRTALAAATQDR